MWNAAVQRNQQLTTDRKKHTVEDCPLAFTVLALQWLKGPHSCTGIID